MCVCLWEEDGGQCDVVSVHTWASEREERERERDLRDGGGRGEVNEIDT